MGTYDLGIRLHFFESDDICVLWKTCQFLRLVQNSLNLYRHFYIEMSNVQKLFEFWIIVLEEEENLCLLQRTQDIADVRRFQEELDCHQGGLLGFRWEIPLSERYEIQDGLDLARPRLQRLFNSTGPVLTKCP